MLLESGWHHVAIANNSGTITMYLNGQSVGTTTSLSGTVNGGKFEVGRGHGRTGSQWNTGTFDFNGSLDEVRVTKGKALWTSNFTPPVSAQTPDSNTKLLLHFDGDRSLSEHDVTFNGGTKMDDTARFGQAAYFDGTGDYLSLPDSTDWDIGTNMTIDLWVKHTDLTTDECYVAQYEDINNFWRFFHINGGGLDFEMRSGGSYIVDITGTNHPLSNNEWTHIALIKIGNEYGVYVNGQQVKYLSESNVDTFAGALLIGNYGNGDDFEGAMESLKITHDNRYGASPQSDDSDSIVVPTIPHSADINTKLLLNMDGPEGSTTFTDSSSSNHLPVANGDVKISGLPDEFGDALSFDGVDDYLSIPDSDDWDFGSEDFTIDFWVNPRSLSGTQYLISQWEDVSNRWYTRIENSNLYTVMVNAGTAEVNTQSSTNSVIQNAWNHIAIIREGNVLKVYLNGSLLIEDSISAGTNWVNPSIPLQVGGQTSD